MEVIQEDRILKFNPDTLQIVRKEYNLDQIDRMNEALDILENWIKKQDHFVKKDFSRSYLERTLISTKGSVERAKSRLDKLCTFRTLMPNFFCNNDIKHQYDCLSTALVHGHLRRPTKDYYRVYVMKMLSEDTIDSANMLNYYKYIIAVSEYIKKNDYCKGFVLVMDYTDINILNLVTKVNPIELHQTIMLLTHKVRSKLYTVTLIVDEEDDIIRAIECHDCVASQGGYKHAIAFLILWVHHRSEEQHALLQNDGYGMRIKGIHLITPSKMVDALLTLLKQVLTAKVAGRIYVHKTVDTLYQYVDKEILPQEYGGNEMSLKELNETWFEILNSKEYTEYLNEMNKASTNESCRHTEKFHEQYLGMPGSFRTLSVD